VSHKNITTRRLVLQNQSAERNLPILPSYPRVRAGPAGDPNQYLMSAAIDANGNQTNFVYDNNHKLLQVLEPPDAPGGQRATTTIAYDASSRIQTITDPVNRQVQFAYDARDRNVTITYGDTSTETFYYGAQGTGNENQLVKSKDRNGVTNQYNYDAAGRLTTTVFAYSTIDANNNETLITDPSVQVSSTLTYLPGTELPASSTDRGETTTFAYDYRQRRLATTVQPRVGVTLTSSTTYLNNLLFSEHDPFGRSTYYAYRSSDGAMIRQIQGTVPSFTLANFTAVTSQTRDQTANAQFLITDFTLDNDAQRVGIVDARANQVSQAYDSRRQRTRKIDAVGSPVAATTAYLYDPNGNTTQVQSPRNFDNNDPQVGSCRTVTTYSGRDLPLSHTTAPGTAAVSAFQGSYNPDRTLATVLDARNNTWTLLWSACCAGRKTAELDPLSGGTSLEYDYAGNLTYAQVLQGTTVYNYTTTAFDARNRPVFRTIWLVAPPAVDPNNPPIAGQNGVPAANGLTTQWVYDENLADNVGLSAAAGQNVAGVGNVSIQPLLAELSADGITFGAGSDGVAALIVRSDGGLLVVVQDGVGRIVGQGIIQAPTGQNPNQPITWTVKLNDTIVNVNGFGSVLETAKIDALNDATRGRTDGAGRTIESLDAANDVTAYTYDGNSNRLSVSDPNSVGYSAVFDARDRLTSRTDTEGAVTQFALDANNNVTKVVDPKAVSATRVFDARDRIVSQTDRNGAQMTRTLDASSNVVSVTDFESRTTSYQYDQRNMVTTETYADHNPPAVSDQLLFAYDGAARLETKTSPNGDYITYDWDQANRLTARQYRDHTKQPADPPNDTDSFAYDGANRMLSAVSGRYGNTTSASYDAAGRLVAESLAVGAQTYTVGRAYDAVNRVTSFSYPDGAVVGRTYTSRGQLQQLSYNVTTAATFAYDAGRRASTRTLGDTPGTVTTWNYAGRNDNLATSLTTANLPGFTYAYDGNKNKTAETISGILQPYGFSTGAAGFDADDRLVTWDRSDGNRNQSWTLTPVGDWQQFVDAGTQHNRTNNAVHETTAIDASFLIYDPKGNVTSNGVTGSAFVWDFDDQLQQATAGGATISFTYDALGRRVSKSAGGATTVFVGAAFGHGRGAAVQEIAEYYLGGAPASPQRKYVYGVGIDEPVIMDSGAQIYYYHFNSQGSVTAVTNQSGAIVECYAYTAYGVPLILAPDGVTPRTTSAIGNPWTFTGRRFDVEAGVHYYRGRYYDPQLGRFLSRDALDWAAGGAGAYEYVGGNPAVYNDPLGTQEEKPGKPGGPRRPTRPLTWYLDCQMPDTAIDGEPPDDEEVECWADEYLKWFISVEDHSLIGDDEATRVCKKWVEVALHTGGCRGVVAMNLGHRPSLKRCYKTMDQAVTAGILFLKSKCPSGYGVFSVNIYVPERELRKYQGDKHGWVDLTEWVELIIELQRRRNSGDPGDIDAISSLCLRRYADHWGGNFDFAFWDRVTNRWYHANVSDWTIVEVEGKLQIIPINGPRECVISTPPTRWHWDKMNKNDRPKDYNVQVFCVDCITRAYTGHLGLSE